MVFPPIYILSLQAVRRFEPLARTLDERGLKYEIVWGVDGRHGLPGIFESQINRRAAQARMGREMSDGEFACALSHRRIYEIIAAGDEPSAIVLEDDAEPSEAFFDVLHLLSSPPCGLLLFDHKNTYVKRNDRLLLSKNHYAHRVTLPPFLATGYMISKEVARYLAFQNGPVVQPSDWPDAILQFDSYACQPRLVVQRDGTDATSSLELGRRKNNHRRRKSLHRLFLKSYWRRWLAKRLSRKLR